MLKANEGDVCPVTKATVGHHKDKVTTHPSVEAARDGAVCPGMFLPHLLNEYSESRTDAFPFFSPILVTGQRQQLA